MKLTHHLVYVRSERANGPGTVSVCWVGGGAPKHRADAERYANLMNRLWSESGNPESVNWYVKEFEG